MEPLTVLWRRLDLPGHDACRLEERADGFRLDGVAVFLHEGVPARLEYTVAADRAWRTQSGRVRGWIGPRAVDLEFTRSRAGVWSRNGVVVPGLEDAIDLDYGFTPATNLLPVRRLALAVGEAADAPAAWLDVETGTLTRMPQRYARRAEGAYAYEAPSVPFAALLEVGPDGFVRSYPGLWEMEVS